MAPRTFPAALLSLPLLIGMPVAGAGAQPVQPLVEGPVPLILKDGRIAEVSIYAVPFLTASSEMPTGVEEELRELIAAFADDCFLTAQVIGHVEPGPDKDGGTLAAHRLARARAERVQEMMTARGLPADSIASVWDWQFSTPESRATVWFFALDPEEGCAGQPLLADDAGGREEVPGTTAGHATEAAPPPAEEAPGDTAAADRPLARDTGEIAPPPATVISEEPAPLTVVVARPGDGDPLPDPSPAARQTDDPPEQPVAATGDGEVPRAAPPPAETVAAATGSGTPPETPAPPPIEKLRAETEPGEVLPRALEPAAGIAGEDTVEEAAGNTATEPAAAEGEPELEIVFDLNSSWLPHGAVRELKHLLERLREGRYALEIVAAVDNGPIKNGTPEDARRYNRWLAERRANRVAEWLRRRGEGVIAGIEQRFRENDPSRKVVIRARPLP